MTMLALATLIASVQWTAKWIGAPEDVADQAFERQFEVTRPVKSAVLHVTGLGFYEAYLNGRKIGDKVLDPSPTDYTRRIFYSTYPIDGLRKGTNTLRILLGHGWYDMRTHTAWVFDAAPWRSRPKALAQLEIDFEDGSHQVVLTDSSWDVVESPIAYDCIREGEVLDGRKTFGRRLGVKAAEVTPPKGVLESGDRYPAAKKVKSVRPQLVTELGNGRWLLSFPVTTSGWLRLALRGLRVGDVVSIRYDENLGDRGGPALPSEGDWNAAKQRVGSRAIDCFFLKSGDETLPKRQANMQVDRFISGGAADMFIPHEFDVTRAVKEGQNEIAVLFRAPIVESQHVDIAPIGDANSSAELEGFRKPAHMIGWEILTASHEKFYSEIGLARMSGGREEDPLRRLSSVDGTLGRERDCGEFIR